MSSPLGDSAEHLQRFSEDRFEQVEPIGEGGHAVVFAAFDKNLQRKVALKLSIDDALPDMLADFGDVGSLLDEARAARGRYTPLREARMLARVDHPGVVSALDVGRLSDDAVAVVMPLLEGGSLAEREAGGSWRHELHVAMHIGKGLVAIHAAGLVHRDLKPENVLFDRDGRPRIADLGVACEREDDDALAERVGTPHYMSPEALAGEPFDPRDDIYAYCFLVFEQLYGHEPFASIEARLKGAVSHIHRPGGVPPRLRRALVKGLRPRREHRWPDMESLLDELYRVQRPASGRGRAAAVGVLATLAVVGVTVFVRAAQADTCEDRSEELLAMWDPAIEAEVRGALGSRKASDALQSWATRWVELRAQECARARRADEPARPSPCAASMRDRFGATVEAFRAPHLREGLRFASLIAELPAPEYCLDHPDDDRYAAGGLLALREVDTELETLLLLGKLDAAREGQARYMSLARTHESAYDLARASYWGARLRHLDGELDGAEALLEQVYREATSLGAEPLGAETMLALTEVAADRGDVPTLEARAFTAQVALEAHAPEQVALLLQVRGLGLLAGDAGQHTRALTLLTQAVERREAEQLRFGGSRERLSQARESLARGLLVVGQPAEADALLELAIADHQQEFGPGAWRWSELHVLRFEAAAAMGERERLHELAVAAFERRVEEADSVGLVRDAQRVVHICIEMGEVVQAQDLHAQAIALAHRLGVEKELAPIADELDQLGQP